MYRYRRVYIGQIRFIYIYIYIYIYFLLLLLLFFSFSFWLNQDLQNNAYALDD